MEGVFSSRFWLATPRFAWRGRWFWGAWLLVFLLPFTRDDARLQLVGSRFFSRLYGQSWQRHFMAPDEPTLGLPPLERAVWTHLKAEDGGFLSYNSALAKDPGATMAGRLFARFPREKWLHARALGQSVTWGSLRGQSALRKWAQAGERLDGQNAFYPLMLAKFWGDSARPTERDAALRRAAACARFDDGSFQLRAVGLRAAREAGVATWGEKWQIWTNLSGSQWGNAVTQTMDGLLNQLDRVSQRDIAAHSVGRTRAALARSGAMMRVALLFQGAPNGVGMWGAGESWTRRAWKISLPSSPRRTALPTLALFENFARAHNDPESVRLARRCDARVRLLAPFDTTRTGRARSPLFSPSEQMLADGNDSFGFGVLFFGAYLLGWWWFVSAFLWFTKAAPSTRAARVVPAAVVVGATVGAFVLLTWLVMSWLSSPTLGWRGPPTGQAEVVVSLGAFWFFAPPLLLALWCALRTMRRHRAAFALPARQSMELGLAPLDAFFLSRAAGVFAALSLGLSIGSWALWGLLNWQGLKGYDWLRFLFPGISTRLIDPALTSFDSPAMPLYSALCAFVLTVVWLGAWRTTPDARLRPVFHEGLRAWKETLGSALTLTIWVYLVLLMACHIQGNVFSHRLDIAATRGDGAFVPGF